MTTVYQPWRVEGRLGHAAAKTEAVSIRFDRPGRRTSACGPGPPGSNGAPETPVGSPSSWPKRPRMAPMSQWWRQPGRPRPNSNRSAGTTPGPPQGNTKKPRRTPTRFHHGGRRKPPPPRRTRLRPDAAQGTTWTAPARAPSRNARPGSPGAPGFPGHAAPAHHTLSCKNKLQRIHGWPGTGPAGARSRCGRAGREKPAGKAGEPPVVYPAWVRPPPAGREGDDKRGAQRPTDLTLVQDPHQRELLRACSRAWLPPGGVVSCGGLSDAQASESWCTRRALPAWPEAERTSERGGQGIGAKTRWRLDWSPALHHRDVCFLSAIGVSRTRLADPLSYQPGIHLGSIRDDYERYACAWGGAGGCNGCSTERSISCVDTMLEKPTGLRIEKKKKNKSHGFYGPGAVARGWCAYTPVFLGRSCRHGWCQATAALTGARPRCGHHPLRRGPQAGRGARGGTGRNAQGGGSHNPF